jgi:chaperone BCS1
LFASTNYIDRLDEALRRPGRFDVHIPFDYAVHEQAADLFRHFYPLSRIHPAEAQVIDEKAETTTSHPFKFRVDLDEAANRFAELTIGQGGKVSIATMQGYLLLYKKDPVMALEKADVWVAGILKEQSAARKVPEIGLA